MKFKHFLLIVFLAFVSLSCRTTVVDNNSLKKEINYIPYYLKVYEADSLFITNNFLKSYQILDSLFQKYEPLNMSVYYELKTYYSAKIILNKDIELNDFSRLVSKYGFTKEMIESDSLLNDYCKKSNFFDLQNYDDLRAKNVKSLNLSLRNEIIEMIGQDQLYRRTDFDKQNKIDSINAKKIIKIFDDFGYPNEFLIGNSSIDKMYVGIEALLLHTRDNERLNYFMPKVLEYVKKGKASPKIYANMRDQFELYHDKEQFYGSYDNKTNTPVDEMNRRRKEIGLPCFGYEKWRTNKLYPNMKF
ncbi:hypothetical protein [Flavobacterium terrae]|uniref:Lipoprotein n=1 Tax=Flavobacterium terrae TaxID=415425 RepID=A0A1M6B9J7_9FLAO|nr:hypothetical protein [Flavobacterium terrae]SHI45409.1 hypothetical protein SAMN05444363_0628 [Flavobacterium terrae]